MLQRMRRRKQNVEWKRETWPNETAEFIQQFVIILDMQDERKEEEGGGEQAERGNEPDLISPLPNAFNDPPR